MNLFFKNSKKIKWLATIMLILGGMAISSNSPVEKDHMPNPDGKELWKYITETSNYENWDQWPQWPGYNRLCEGQSPHGAFLKLYVNDVAKKTNAKGKKILPANAIIVKENYKL